MIDDDELELLKRVAVNLDGPKAGALVDIDVNACAYSCCGRGWHRRDGYWQQYRGYVDNLTLPERAAAGTFMLYNAGIGSLYVVAVRFQEVEEVRYAAGNGRRRE